MESARRRKTVLLGVTGSIAAYKACMLVRELSRRGLDVRVAMTDAAREFVSPLTFQTLSRNPVALGQFDPPAEWKPEHVALADSDVVAVAPCTANTMAKMARGMADNLLTSVLLATKSPVVVAPAMNDGMWTNAATRENTEILRSRGVRFVLPDDGELACGASGPGRLADVDRIADGICAALRDAEGARRV